VKGIRALFACARSCRSLVADAPECARDRKSTKREDSMRRREFMTLLGGVAAFPTIARAQTTQPHPLDVELQRAVERKDAAGVVVMAANRKGIVYQGAFGVADIDQASPLKIDSMFRIASMTKAITSTAAMQLMEQGRIALDDPVSKYFPEFANLQVFDSFDPATGAYRLRPATTPVTVRHLHTHTSGLGYPFTSAILRDFKPRAGENYPVGPLLFEPGTRWHYGTSVDWLGRLVEKVSGAPLEDYFRQKIFTPLAMPDTSYFVAKDKEARLVTVNRRRPDGTLVREATQPPTSGFTPIGGGGLTSTVGDYIRFARMILSGGELDGVRVLSGDSVAQMSRNQIGAVSVPALKSALADRSEDFSFITDGRDKWGLGFLITTDEVPGKRSAGSLSWGGINNTYYWIDPSRDLTGVIMMQFLPFADKRALGVYDTFERGVYRGSV
jgi:CubicO group peptidase (beta-lactamase class C family)